MYFHCRNKMMSPTTISRAVWKRYGRRMCHTNRRSISDQDEYNLPAGRCQAAAYPARKKQTDPMYIHLKLSDVFSLVHSLISDDSDDCPTNNRDGPN